MSPIWPIVLAIFSICACGESDASPWPDLQVGLTTRIEPGACVGSDAPPAARLSEHRCFTGSPPRPADSFVEYAPASELWSDGAAKDRFVSVPTDASMLPGSGGHLELPPGAVLVKHFRFDDRPVETRIMERDGTGEWHFVSYRWLDDGDDAVQSEGEEVPIGDGTWVVPSVRQCRSCHTEAAGTSLGLTVAQLNNELLYEASGMSGHQLATLAAVGMLATEGLDHPTALPAHDAGDPRAYLDTNCANCHRPGGGASTALDLRWNIEVASMRACGVKPEFGSPTGEDHAILEAGDPEESVLLQVMQTTSSLWRMPPVGSDVVDERGVGLVEEWIRQLDGCPDES
jgi:hypothetical protein